MKIITLFLFLFPMAVMCQAQEAEFKVYDPTADANKDIAAAVSKAKADQKHVLLQIGGNWCKWCRLYEKWSHETHQIDSLLKADYVVVFVNYSPENKNQELLKKMQYPQRFGFPVMLILDENGNRIHTQNTGYLEDGEGYSEKKVADFLKGWNHKALDSASYK